MIQLRDPGELGKGIGVAEAGGCGMAESTQGALLLFCSCEGKGPWANSCEGRAQPMSEIRKLSLPPLFTTRLIEAGDVSCD